MRKEGEKAPAKERTICWADVCLGKSIYSCCMTCDERKSCSDVCDVTTCRYYEEEST